jgi:hypothetical protein
MRIATVVTSLFLILAALFLLDAGPANSEPCNIYEDGVEIPVENCSEIRVTGHSRGNHELDCTVIRPWESSPANGKGKTKEINVTCQVTSLDM